MASIQSNVSIAFLLSFLSLCFSLSGQNYKKADSIAALHYGRDLHNLSLLAADLTKDLSTDKEKFRALFSWVCHNIEVDHLQFKRIEKNRYRLRFDSLKLNEYDRVQGPLTIIKLHQTKRTVCTGYAYLLASMAEIIGIECKIINGYARTANSEDRSRDFPNHSWNAVKLDGKWQLCDPTWSSGYSYVQGSLAYFETDYNEGYFLCPPKFFALNHIPQNPKWLLDSSIDKSHNQDGPLVYGAAFKNQIFPDNGEKMIRECARRDSIYFNFQSLKKLESQEFYIQISNGFNSREMELRNLASSENSLRFNHVFEKSGIYDVHILANTDVLASYTLTVYKP